MGKLFSGRYVVIANIGFDVSIWGRRVIDSNNWDTLTYGRGLRAREELWGVMQDLWITHRPTVLLVTHDLKEAAYLANRICVMQARPGRIIEQSVVTFPRPRTIAMSYDPDFVTLTQQLRELIMISRPPKETVQ